MKDGSFQRTVEAFCRSRGSRLEAEAVARVGIEDTERVGFVGDRSRDLAVDVKGDAVTGHDGLGSGRPGELVDVDTTPLDCLSGFQREAALLAIEKLRRGKDRAHRGGAAGSGGG